MTICAEPINSVLFDGNISTLTGLNGVNMTWASQLFTLSINSMSTEMTLNFHESVRINRIEVVMFQCPEWDIEIEYVQVQAPHSGVTIGGKSVNISSCNSLVKVSICQLRATTSSLVIQLDGTQMTIAEMTFYNADTCPPDTTITRPSQPASSLPVHKIHQMAHLHLQHLHNQVPLHLHHQIPLHLHHQIPLHLHHQIPLPPSPLPPPLTSPQLNTITLPLPDTTNHPHPPLGSICTPPPPDCTFI
jgi:hypothetical protein